MAGDLGQEAAIVIVGGTAAIAEDHQVYFIGIARRRPPALARPDSVIVYFAPLQASLN